MAIAHRALNTPAPPSKARCSTACMEGGQTSVGCVCFIGCSTAHRLIALDSTAPTAVVEMPCSTCMCGGGAQQRIRRSGRLQARFKERALVRNTVRNSCSFRAK